MYPVPVMRPTPNPRPTRRRHVALAAAALSLVGLGLTGCYNGQEATTNVQATQPSGNGNVLKAGQIVVDNATAVQDEAGNATVLMRITNQGDKADTLIAAVLANVPATITPNSIDIGPGQSISFAWESTNYVSVDGLNAPMSSYVQFGLQFLNAGITSTNIMIVPPVGMYAGITQN